MFPLNYFTTFLFTQQRKLALYLFLIGTGIILSSCKSTRVPSDILPEDTMVQILTDVHIAEAMLTKQWSQDTVQLHEAVKAYYDDIYKKYGINDSLYTKSMDYYSTHLTQMKNIYDKVVLNINKEAQ